METFLSRAALAAAAMALGLSGTYASTATGNLSVSLTVNAPCTVGASSLNFVSTGLSDTDGAGSISITCPSGTPYAISLDNGLRGNRQMRNTAGTAGITYEIYSDSGHSTVWNTCSPVSQKSNGTDTISVYGHASSSGATPGFYLDTVVITVSY